MAKEGADATVYGNHDVIIIGGGPVGLFCGLVLAQKGIDVLVLEAEADIVPSPRALMYFPIVLHEFAKAGILDDVLAAGYKNQSGLTFRTPASGTNKILAQISLGKPANGSIDYGVQLGQPAVCAIVRKHALLLPNFCISYLTRFSSLQETEDGVEVRAICTSDGVGKEEEKRYSARFAIACDGASSPVRKSLDIPFSGYTWTDWRFLAINIRYDFSAHGYGAANHIIDPEDWAVIVRASNEEEGLWRIATGIRPDIPVEEIEHCLPQKLERLLPGPRPLAYELVAVNPYWAHEKVAGRYVQGRVVLCGDAAHINNPLTALGLTTGLVDVAVLSHFLPRALSPAHSHRWPQLLGRYAHLRRSDFVGNVQKQALEGKLRMHSTDKKVVAQREDFFNMLNKNPGFATFVASTMMETLPEELEMGFW
ncbi:MAG: hypothetical protein LQ341_003859 [Variospora aurantia]|nr:MAG: hypothetical protein LQ341_003859 [Variospora aurantia]